MFGTTMEEAMDAIEKPPHEYSAWMRDTMARRIAELRSQDRGRVAFRDGVMVTYLAYDADPDDPQDRACDKCRTIVPPEGELLTFAQMFKGARPGVPDLILVGGFCRPCAEAEGLTGGEQR